MVPILSQRALDRALLARQLLLERVALPIPEALEQVGGSACGPGCVRAAPDRRAIDVEREAFWA